MHGLRASIAGVHATGVVLPFVAWVPPTGFRRENHVPANWQIQIDGKTYGPFDDARMKALVKQGKITPDTLVCIASQGRWVAAKIVKGLFPVTQQPEREQPQESARPVAPQQVAPQPPPRRRAAPATPVGGSPGQVPAVVAPVQQVYNPAPAYDPAPLDFTAGQPVRPNSTARRAADRSGDSTLNVMLGFAGAGALLLGFFCPIIRLPIIGSMSYLNVLGLQLKKGDVNELTIAAFLTLAGMVGGVVVAVVKRRQLFWLPAIAGATAALLTVAIFIRIQMDMSRNLDRNLKDNPFRGLAEALAQSVSLDIGIGVVVIGTALLIAAAVVPEKRA